MHATYLLAGTRKPAIGNGQPSQDNDSSMMQNGFTSSPLSGSSQEERATSVTLFTLVAEEQLEGSPRLQKTDAIGFH